MKRYQSIPKSLLKTSFVRNTRFFLGLILVTVFLPACSYRLRDWQGDCTNRNVSKKIDNWVLLKEICFVNPSEIEQIKSLKKRGIIKSDPLQTESTQLWLDVSTYKKTKKIVNIDFLQRAVFVDQDEKDTATLPEYLRKNASIDCSTSMYKDKKGSYKLTTSWKKDLYQPPANSYNRITKEYNPPLNWNESPLNPYVEIESEFCSIVDRN